jgi:hypothetical protein
MLPKFGKASATAVTVKWGFAWVSSANFTNVNRLLVMANVALSLHVKYLIVTPLLVLIAIS